MKLSDYFNNHSETRFRYYGTVLGDIEMVRTGAEWAKIVSELDADAPFADIHPDWGHYRREGRWYWQGERIGWAPPTPGVTELCFEMND